MLKSAVATAESREDFREYVECGEYPDGGDYELEDNGIIRIRFTVIPKLKKIQLVVVPVWADTELEWQCHTEGEISRAVLPSWCRGAIVTLPARQPAR